jgi:hypothetical protein
MMHRTSGFVLLLAFSVTVVLFVAAYWEAFKVLPASDDFSYINEIHRGTREGVLVFFTRSVTGQSYRPMTSVGIWAFGNLLPGYPTQGVRALHLLSAVVYAGIALLWIRLARLGAVGAAVVILIMLLHPVLPQAVGSIDGFNSLISSAFLWLGAWYILTWRDRPTAALLAAAACFVAGSLFKEYTFGLAPLSMLTVLCFWWRGKTRYALTFAGVTALLMVMAIWIRRFTVPRDIYSHGGWEYVTLDPVQLARNIVTNAALLASGILFLGNSIWVFVNQSPAVLAFAGAAMLGVVLLIAWGISIRLRQSPMLAGGHPTSDSEPPAGSTRALLDERESLPRWLIYLLLSFAATSFPAILVHRVSEMYVPPLVLPMALLCGFAADGFCRGGLAVRTLAATAGVVALLSSLYTIRVKVEGLIDVGLRAERQINQILALLPPDAENQAVAIRFLASDRRPRDLYAVFRMPDHLLLVHKNVLHWPRPYRGLVLDSDTVTSFRQLDPDKYDLALGWDTQKQQFFRLGRESE